ncbi:MAG TPA: right-handed parallel beta-helix repeat-containing protein [Sedimentisphaerales bacterium]|nr:right-handed parallel beta-helix repeat-containing protein [Sedimentisphaerales bacterium]
MEKVRKISNKYCLRQIVAWFLVWCLFFNVPVAFATPSGADVVAGSAGVGQAGNTTTVNMGSARAVINWDSLNTCSSEILQFLKASGSFAVLNKVVQGGATQFDGSLFGNQGHIIIVNPQGIIFGPTSLVQAYKFTASGLDIANNDFMNGHYQFVAGDGVGKVANYGQISAEQVALIGKQVLNAGIIRSPAGGYVLMAAGDRVFLGQEGSDIVVEVQSVQIVDPTDPGAAGMGDVINEGTVEAAGGKIVLAAGDTFSRAIEGLDSLTLAVSGGTGRVGQFGTLNADAPEGDGGNITLTAGDVVALSSDSLTTANAGANGDGGQVIVYSPETALFRDGAAIEAKGGAESGDGGFVEVSGKQYMVFEGEVDASAAAGENGNLLIDPARLEIKAAEAGTPEWDEYGDGFYYDRTDQLILAPVDIVTELGLQNVLLQADDLITVTDPVSYSSQKDLKMETTADDSHIVVNAGVTNADSGNLILNVGNNGSIDLDADLSTNGMLSGNARTVNVISPAAQIQDAVGIAHQTEESTINVSPGLYEEGWSFAIDKPVTLQSTDGADNTTVEVGGLGMAVISDDVTVDGFTFTTDEQDDESIGLLLVGADPELDLYPVQNVTIKNNIFEGLQAQHPFFDLVYGAAVMEGTTNVSITDNTFINIEAYGDDARAYGIAVMGAGAAGEGQGIYIHGNTISNIAAFDSSETFVPYLSAGIAVLGSTNIENTGNDISGTGSGIYLEGAADVKITQDNIHENDTGILISSLSGPAEITENFIQDNAYGVAVDDSAEQVTLNYNRISGNEYGVLNEDGGNTLNAAANWWGDEFGPQHYSNPYEDTTTGDRVSGDVDFSPWWANDAGTSWRMLPSTDSADFAEWVQLAGSGATLDVDYIGDGTLPAIDDEGKGLNLNVSSTGSLTVGGSGEKFALGGDLNMNAAGTVTVNAQIDPDVVRVEAGDIDVFSLITADSLIWLEAGTGGAGSVTVDHSGTNTGSLETTQAGSDITIIAGSAGSGDISLLGPATIQTKGATGDGHEITLTANNGAITMADGSLINAGNGTIDMEGSGDITLSAVQTMGSAAVTSTAGKILNDGNPGTRLIAPAPLLAASSGIGTDVDPLDTEIDRLDAVTTTGSIYVKDYDLDLRLDSVLASSGSVTIEGAKGSIMVDTVTADSTAGTVTIIASDTFGAITNDGDPATYITAHAADLDAKTAIGASAAGTGALDTKVNELTAVAHAGSIYINNDVTSGDLGLDSVSASGIVEITNTTGAITDGTVGDAAANIDAISAVLTALSGIGGAGEADIDTAVGSLEASTSTGGIYVSNVGGLTIGGVTGDVAGAQVTDPTGGAIAIMASSPLTVSETVSAPGDITLTADGDDLTLAANVTSTGTGTTIELNAGDGIIQNSGTVSVTGGGAINALVAGTGGFTQAEEASFVSNGGDIRVSSGGDIAIALLDAQSAGGSGDVVVYAEQGKITDNTAGEAANIKGAGALLMASTGIGGADAADIDTEIDNLVAQTATGGIYVSDGDALTIGGVSAAPADAGVEVSGASGDIAIAAGGKLTVTERVAAPGNITLNGSSVDLDADLDAGGFLGGDNTAINVLGSTNGAQIQDAVGIAISSSSTPATIDVAEGTYDEGSFDVDKEGLTLQSTGAVANTVVKVDGFGMAVISDDVTVDGFTFTTDQQDNESVGLLVVGADTSLEPYPVDNVTIKNNVFQGLQPEDTFCDFAYGAAVVGDATNVSITDNTFSELGFAADDVTQYGILIGDPDMMGSPEDIRVTGNTLEDIKAYGDDAQAYGIAVIGAGAADEGQGIYIHDNTISDIAAFDSFMDPDPDLSAGIAVFDSTNIENTGNNIFWTGSGIYLENAADVKIRQDDIHENETGIYISSLSGPAEITENFIQDNDTGVYVADSADQVSINYNSISGNADGIYNDTDNILDAMANWWGDATGPSDKSNDGTFPPGLYNPAGGGDPVTDYVNYNPWLGKGGDAEPGTPGFQPESPMDWGMVVNDPAAILAAIAFIVDNGGSFDSVSGDWPGDITLPVMDFDGSSVNISITATGVLTVGGKITTGGNVMLGGVGANGSTGVIINADIDPATVHIPSNDDVTINAFVQADEWIKVEAGLDGTGSIVWVAPGSLETFNNGGTIEMYAGTVAGTSGDIAVGGPVTTNAGNITLNAYHGTVEMTSSGSLNSTGGNIAVAADVVAPGGGGAIMMANGALVDAGNAKIDMDADGDITLGGLVTTNNAADAITIDSAGGGVVDGGGTNLDIVTGASGTVVINAATGIGAADAIDTTIGTLEAHTTAGDVVIDETDNITLADVDTGDGSIDIASGASIELADLDNVISAGSGGDVTLSAADSITVLDATTAAEIQNTGSVTLTAKAVGATNPLDLAGATALTINDLDGAGQDMVIREQGGSSIASTTITVATPTAGNIDIDYSGTDVVNIDEGHILTNVDLDLDGTGGRTFTYTATTGDITIDTVNTGDEDVTITATDGAISGVSDDATADIAGDTVTLVAGSGNIRGADAFKALDVTATTALNADTTGDDGDIAIDSIGDLPVGLLNAGSGNVTLDSDGAINDHDVDAVVDIKADELTMTAQGEIGGAEEIETQVNTLNASAQAAGDIDIAEEDTIMLASLQTTSGAIDVTSSTGDIKVGAISAGAGNDDVSLTASGGSILDDGFAYLFADEAVLNALGDIGEAETTSGSPLHTKVNTLEAHAGGSIYVTENLQDLTLASVSAGADIDIINIDGDITVGATISAAGDIDLESDEDDIIVSGTGMIDLDGSNGSTLTLYAGDDILIEGPIEDSDAGDDAVHVMLFAGDGDPGDSLANIRIAASITTGGGNFSSSGTTFNNEGGIINTAGTTDGSIQINVHQPTDKVSLGADLDGGTDGAISGNAALIDVLSSAAQVQDAIDIVRPAGDATITVFDGTYQQNLYVDKPDITLKSDEGKSVTTLTADGGWVVTIDDDGDNFVLGGANGEGFTIHGAGGEGGADLVLLTNGPENVDISYNTLNTTGSSTTLGIKVDAAGTRDLTITNNEFFADGSDTSILGEAPITNLLVSDNEFTGGTGATAMDLYGVAEASPSSIQDNTIDGFGIGISVGSGTAATPTEGLDILRNEIMNGTDGIVLGDTGFGLMKNVTVQANNIHDNTGTGLVIQNVGVDSTPAPGDFFISVTNNFFTNNDKGVQSLHASESAAIGYNSFSGNTTYAVENAGTLAMLDAEANWWGHMLGPKHLSNPFNLITNGDSVSDKVDYNPWLGFGDDADSDPTNGFQPVSPMHWWTMGSLQHTIDLASPGDTIFAAAKTYNESIDVDKGLAGLNFVGDAVAKPDSAIAGNVTLSNTDDNWDEGTLDIMTLGVSVDQMTWDVSFSPGNTTLTLNSDPGASTGDVGEHGLTLDTGPDGTIDLDGDVTIGGDLTLMSDTVVADGKKLFSFGGSVMLASGENMEGEGALTIEADELILLGGTDQFNPGTGSAGNLTAAGPLTLNAHESIYAHGTITTDPGGAVAGAADIHLYSSDNTTHLFGDVTADVGDGGDIFVHNRSQVSEDVTLKAGRNVTIEALMTALGDLTIEAGDLTNTNENGKIQALVGIDMPQATTPPAPPDRHTLTLRQNDDLNMQENVLTVGNADNTNLVAQSTAGSVTEQLAERWLSIEARAETFISLDDSDTPGTITTKTLTAVIGDILVKSDLGKVEAYGPIDAGQDVKIAALDEGPDGSDDAIFLRYNATDPAVEAGRDIWLANNTLAADGVSLKAGQDVRVGWQGDQGPFDPKLGQYESKTLTGEGALTVEADRHITLGGAVKAAGPLTLRADADYLPVPPAEDGGNMWAMSSLTTTGVNSDMLVEGQNIRVEGPADSSAKMEMYASDNATLEDNVTATGDIALFADWDVPGPGYENGSGDLTVLGNIESTDGSIELRADDDTINLASDWVEAWLDITLWDNTVLNGSTHQRIDAETGTLWAMNTVTKKDGEGDLTLGGGAGINGINLDGTVDVQTTGGGSLPEAGGNGSLIIEDSFTAAADLLAQGSVYFTDATKSNVVNATLDGSVNQQIRAENGMVYANGSIHKTEPGNLSIFGGVDSGDSVWTPDVDGTVTVDTGELEIKGNSGVRLGGSLYSSDNMTIVANNNASGSGNLVHTNGTIKSENGTVSLSAIDNKIELRGSGAPAPYVQAGEDILLNDDTEVTNAETLDAARDVILADGETLKGLSDLTIEADRHITLGGATEAAGNLTLKADDDPAPDNDGDLLAKDDLTSGGWLRAWGDNITINGAAQSGTDAGAADKWMELIADRANNGEGDLLAKGTVTSGDWLEAYGDDITFEAPASSATSMYLKADSVDEGSGDLTTNSLTSGTWMEAYGNNITINALAQSGGYMYLEADSTWNNSGDLTTQGLTSGSSLEAYGDNVTLQGPVSSATTMLLNADSTYSGEGDLLAKGTLTSGDYLEAYGDDITFEAPASSTTSMYLRADSVGDGSGDLTTNSLTSGTWMEAYGNNITINALAQSGEYMYLLADSTSNNSGDLTTQGLTSGASLEAYGDNITINGAAQSGTDAGAADKYMYLEADSTYSGEGDLLAKGTITSGDYLEAYGDDITFEAPASSEDYMYLQADSAGDDTGSIVVHGLDAGGTIDIYASDYTINIHKSTADPAPDADVYSDEDIRLWNNTVAEPGVKLHADWDVLLDSGKSLTGDGTLTVEAGENILLGVDDQWNPEDGGSPGNVSAVGDLVLDAGEDVWAYGQLKAGGDITISSSDSTTYLITDLVEATGNVNLNNNTEAADGILIHAVEGDVIVGVETETVNPADYPGIPGLLPGVYTDTYLEGYGALTVEAGSDVIVGGELSTDGAMLVTAGDNISVGSASADGDMDMTATTGNITAGRLFRIYDLDPVDGDLVFKGGDLDVLSTAAGHNMALTAAGSISFRNAKSYSKWTGTAYEGGNMTMTAEAGDITAGVVAPTIWAGGPPLSEVVTVTQGGHIGANEDMTLLADNDVKAKYVNWDTWSGGSVWIEAGHDIVIGEVLPTLKANVYDSDGKNVGTQVLGDTQEDVLNVHKGGYAGSGEDMTLLAGNDIKVKTAQSSGGDLLMTAERGDILIGGPAPHAVAIDEGEYGTAEFDKGGRLYAGNGTITLSALSEDGDISLKMAQAGDDITMTAGGNITLRTNATNPGQWAEPDRTESFYGDIRLHALNGDISIGGDVAVVEPYELIAGYVERGLNGGVSLIADNGKIFTPGGDNDTLSAIIAGYSNQAEDIGVELPQDPDQKAAIVIISADTLKLGPDAELWADGIYDTTGEVDDRAAIKFLDVEGTVIGGVPRKAGDPFDAAIYLASTTGDVDVSSPVSILSSESAQVPDGDTEPIGEPMGAMVIDAYDTVTFDNGVLFNAATPLDTLFQNSLANGQVGDRLEVASRITEWLFQAVLGGTLPYAGGGGPFPTGYNYVLRGAGLGNPAITDGRAWVLENPTPPAPLYREAGERTEPQEFGEGGCPALMAWLADELGVAEEAIEVYVADTFAYSTDIQPCEMCARLKDAATVLADDTLIASLAQVVNEFITTPAPPSEEQMASIAAALAGPEAGTSYASAAQWIDALVAYVGILNTEMGMSIADSAAAANKYVAAVTETGNESLIAYVQARLAAMGG